MGNTSYQKDIRDIENQLSLINKMGNTSYQKNLRDIENELSFMRDENNKLKKELLQKDNNEVKDIVLQDFKEYYDQINNKLAVHNHENDYVKTGEVFKLLFGKDKLFVKWMNKDMIHYGFKYQEGLNVDTVPFNPTGTCDKGGLYFTTINHISVWSTNKTAVLRLVEIPDDAKVYCLQGANKWKADKIIIKEIIEDKFIRLYKILNRVD